MCIWERLPTSIFLCATGQSGIQELGTTVPRQQRLPLVDSVSKASSCGLKLLELGTPLIIVYTAQ
jgi:hypothetical protein